MGVKKLQVVERYDSLSSSRLLDVEFRLADINQPSYVKSFKTSYASVRRLHGGMDYDRHYVQQEFWEHGLRH